MAPFSRRHRYWTVSSQLGVVTECWVPVHQQGNQTHQWHHPVNTQILNSQFTTGSIHWMVNANASARPPNLTMIWPNTCMPHCGSLLCSVTQIRQTSRNQYSDGHAKDDMFQTNTQCWVIGKCNSQIAIGHPSHDQLYQHLTCATKPYTGSWHQHHKSE